VCWPALDQLALVLLSLTRKLMYLMVCILTHGRGMALWISCKLIRVLAAHT